MPAQVNLTHIEGSSEHPIDFIINFNGKKGHAGVRIKYHNYTCEHDIFCAVGRDPVLLTDKLSKTGDTTDPDKAPDDKTGEKPSKIWWDISNVYRFEADGTPVLAENPLEEGSLFRRRNNTAILATNNRVLGHCPVNFDVLKAGETNITSQNWSTLGDGADNKTLWDIPDEGKGHRIATIKDFYTLMDESSEGELNYPIKQAYGVLYGDAATEVQYTQEGAYRYMRGEAPTKGMRGCIVYNVNTLKHIFLPIGNSGYGHRKMDGVWASTDAAGTLRYASRSTPFSGSESKYGPENVTYQPIFEDLYRRNGAIYWCRQNGYKDKNNKTSTAFDINYFSFSFQGYNNDATSIGKGDAAFVRTVYTTDPTK